LNGRERNPDRAETPRRSQPPPARRPDPPWSRRERQSCG
jgi:hypothetical protein